MTRTFTVDMQPVGRRAEISADETLLDAARSGGVDLMSVCGGIGACDTCRVRLIEGRLSEPTMAEEAEFSADELSAGWRLACQARPLSNVKVDIPPESLTTPQRLQIEGDIFELELDPPVFPLDVTLPVPTMYDLRADVERLNDTLREQGHPALQISLPVMAAMATRLRDNDWSVRLAVRGGREIVAVLPPATPLLGFAVDIGTTGMAAYLVSMETGEVLAKTGAMNPQIAYGEDVISRIVYVNEHSNGQETLQKRLIDSLNGMIDTLCSETGNQPEQIVEMVAVGNTAMHHIFAGLPVRQLGEAPYLPVLRGALEFPARLLGLNLTPGAYVYMPPNVAGYVGADHVAMLMATRAWNASETTIAIDIGTNTEVSLIANGRRLSCSCASGPAFEGAHIRDGMRAAPGAIERVQLIDGQVHIQTIGSRAPVGICGSGILDAVATLIDGDMVDFRGVFTGHPLLKQGADGKPVFVLAEAPNTEHGRAVVINRKDISEIQLAKAAIRAGVEILLEKAGISAADVQSFVIAGAFGTYINIEGAVRIGMFPELPLERFSQVGNAAGVGAWQLLTSQKLRGQVGELIEDIEYIELTTYENFQSIFMESIALEASL